METPNSQEQNAISFKTNVLVHVLMIVAYTRSALIYRADIRVVANLPTETKVLQVVQVESADLMSAYHPP
jgi:hypothetical protein